uniref:ERI1 exoribonuclease 2 n=1 Tax=Centroberyx gerrardi TaxID=166262 RepID=UPI003AABDC2A
MSTKKLAKELGLVRKRSQSTGLKKSLVSNQTFSYLIVIDFESTCWKEKNNYGQEIIEFPAVLLNTSTGEVESEFHTYVQPQEHPILSAFCTELTGITQRQVEAGVPLHICLSRFSRWLQSLQLQMGVVFPKEQRGSAPSTSQKPCAFLTWSDWDLGVCLQYECKRKQLHKPDILNSWIDLRSTYRLFYNRKPKGLNGALQDLGIQFCGREHSGLDDSRNTAQLAVRMMRDGCVMKITKSQERTPLMAKPLFGNTTCHGDNKKEKHINSKEEKMLATVKPSSSKTPPKSCSEKINRGLDTKENSNSNLLLNGTTTPLWGRSSSRSVKVQTVTNLSSSIMVNVPSPRNNHSSLVLCSTTVDCLSHLPQPDQTSKTEATVGLTKEDEAAEILVETEEGCGSYDDVVLEGDDFISDLYRENGKCDTEYISDLNSGCSLWKETNNSHSVGGQTKLRSKYNMTKTPCAENSKGQKLETSESSHTSVSTNSKRSHVNASDHFNATRLHSTVSLPDAKFAVPKPVAWHSKSPASISNRHTDAQRGKASSQRQDEPKASHNNSKTFNTYSLFRPKPVVPEKTSNPTTSFAMPKAVITQHNTTGTYSKRHKETVKTSFTIYTDPANQAAASSHPSSVSLRTPQCVLASSSANIPFLSTSRSSIPLTSRGGAPKITSPLCGCGRRAKRQVVANGGPNHGRGFYCCPVRRSGSGARIQKGCEFFKWESALVKGKSPATPAVGSSVSLCQFSSSLHCRPPQSSSLRKSY